MGIAAELTEARRILCLAAVTYRGFEGPLRDALHDERLERAVARGLVDLAAICGAHDLVWGPVTYRAPFSLADDEMMFVARDRSAPHRYVVAIRGTNPVSAFDWLFGDFWVAAQVPWPYGEPGGVDAKVSFSTLLGLNVLQIMQSPVPPAGLLDTLHARLADVTNDALDDVRCFLAPLQASAAPELRSIRDEVLPLLAQMEGARRARTRREPAAHVLGLIDDWRSATRQRAFDRMLEAVGVLAADHSFNVLRVLEGGARLRASLDPGVTLLAFLRAAVAAAAGDPVDVVVTGHSKGGALATALALWLADTQGQTDQAFRWDPRREATVRCFAFAGPTAGNAALAARVDRVLGTHCHRIPNALDVVPHAWRVEDLDAIGTLYTNARPVPLLRDLLAEIVSKVGPLGYAHTRAMVTELPGTETAGLTDFFLQLVDQHLAGYLRALELTDVSALTFFSPLS